jgi:hypothetical protein
MLGMGEQSWHSLRNRSGMSEWAIAGILSPSTWSVHSKLRQSNDDGPYRSSPDDRSFWLGSRMQMGPLLPICHQKSDHSLTGTNSCSGCLFTASDTANAPKHCIGDFLMVSTCPSKNSLARTFRFSSTGDLPHGLDSATDTHFLRRVAATISCRRDSRSFPNLESRKPSELFQNEALERQVSNSLSCIAGSRCCLIFWLILLGISRFWATLSGVMCRFTAYCESFPSI